MLGKSPRSAQGAVSEMDVQVKESGDAIQIATPLYLITISKSDWSFHVRASQASKYSKHQALVLSLVEQLQEHGVRELNADGITEVPLNRSLSLACGRGRADVVYLKDGLTYHIEVETSERLGHQVTAEQLGKLASGSENVLLAVPLGALPEASRVLRLIGLNRRVKVIAIE